MFMSGTPEDELYKHAETNSTLPRLTSPWTHGPSYTALPAQHQQEEESRRNIATGLMPVMTSMHKCLLRTFSLPYLIYPISPAAG